MHKLTRSSLSLFLSVAFALTITVAPVAFAATLAPPGSPGIVLKTLAPDVGLVVGPQSTADFAVYKTCAPADAYDVSSPPVLTGSGLAPDIGMQSFTVTAAAYKITGSSLASMSATTAIVANTLLTKAVYDQKAEGKAIFAKIRPDGAGGILAPQYQKEDLYAAAPPIVGTMMTGSATYEGNTQIMQAGALETKKDIAAASIFAGTFQSGGPPFVIASSTSAAFMAGG